MTVEIEGIKYYSTGEFMRLCGVTRDTLVHYDKMGLLPPDHIGENGYRYYRYTQCYMIKWIQFMQMLDVSLGEIKHNLETDDIDFFIKLLDETEEKFRKQITKSQILQRCLLNTKETLRESNRLKEKPNTIYIDWMDKTFLYISEPSLEVQERWKRVYVLTDFIDEIIDRGIMEEFTVGTITPQNRLLDREYSMSHWFIPISRPIDEERLHVKEEGYYAICTYKGDYAKEKSIYDSMLETIQRRGYKVAGPLYEKALQGIWPIDQDNNYTSKLMIKVEKKDINVE